MPELPDIELYLHALNTRVVGQPLRRVRVKSPSLLKTFDPPISTFADIHIQSLRRIGKRIVLEFEDELALVLHLMVAGRLQWRDEADAKIPARVGLAAFDFPEATLLLTEASKKKRARLHAVRGADALAEHDPGGAEPLELSREAFAERLQAKNHTLKRALTDPRIFSGIGNSYSDEILFAAKLPPQRWTTRLTDDELDRLHAATQSELTRWKEQLVAEAGDQWPAKVSAFHPEMNVHGRFGEPCRVCGQPVQRIAYAGNETNYCARCQNGGKLLADRGLSRLLKGDWPKTLEELEAYKAARKL